MVAALPAVLEASRASIIKRRRYARPVGQAVQVFGALLILFAFAAAQFGALNQRSRVYLVLNLVGSAADVQSVTEALRW